MISVCNPVIEHVSKATGNMNERFQEAGSNVVCEVGEFVRRKRQPADRGDDTDINGDSADVMMLSRILRLRAVDDELFKLAIKTGVPCVNDDFKHS